MSDNNIKRVNMRMGQDLHDWFEQKADQLGVPTSALMIIAMNEYRKIQTGSDHLPMLQEAVKMLQSGALDVRSSASGAVLDVERVV